jgi:hypothetical protein
MFRMAAGVVLATFLAAPALAAPATPSPAPELGAGLPGFLVAAGVAFLLDRRTRQKP